MRLALLLAATVRLCGSPAEEPVSPPAREEGDPATRPEPPVAEGEPLEATIPLLSGDTTRLSELRGRVVILELSATDRPGWSEAHRHYRSLVAAGDVEVVAVSADPAPEPLQEDWDTDTPPFVLAWDPQGALALRLGVKALPTTFVLDPLGRIVGATVGFDAGTLAEIDKLVEKARAPGRSELGSAAR
jgi:peroxiredoxin